MVINVHTVEPAPGSTVWQGEGVEPESGDTVRFGGDWRAMEGLMLMLEDFGEVEAEVEDWQILSRTKEGS